MSKKALHIIECLAIVAVAFALRFVHIDKADIGNDECFSLYYAQKSVPDIITSLASYDNPPLWEIVLHYWIAALGLGTLTLRLLSTIFSALTVVPIFLTGERHIGRGAGLVASLMFSFASFSLFLAHDGRVYSLVGMLSAWSLYFFLTIINSTKNKGWNWMWLTLCNILLFYCHYMTVWIPATQLVTVAILPKARRYAKQYFISLAAIIASCLPLGATLATRIADSGVNGTWIARTHSIESLYHMMCSLTNAPVTASSLLVIVGMAAALAIIQIAGKKFKPTTTTALSIMWTVPLLASFAVSFFLGLFLNRYFYFTLPAYLLALTAYVRMIAPKPLWLNVLLNIALVALMAVTFNADSTKMRYGGWKGDTKAVATKINELNSTDDCNVLLAPAWIDKQMVYYFDSDHSIFATQGKLQQPVFYNYLTTKGFLFCDSIRPPTSPTIHVVREPWYNIDSWFQLFAQMGYIETEIEHHNQMDIITFKRAAE